MMDNLDTIVYYLPKLATALLCGLIIGWDRESKHKSAGLRTNILVAISCALIVAASAREFGEEGVRLTAQMLSGIGFIGAGAIFKSVDRVVGLTTAAMIWLLAAVSMLVGLGYVIVPAAVCVLSLVVSGIVSKVGRHYIKDQDE